MPRPNFLFLMADQHRHDYLSLLGTPGVRTPHLDALAARGMCFTHCCTNSPVCAPARISLATGLHPVHVGCLDNNAYLPRSRETYYQRLRDGGYRVGCVGKLDLAKPDPYNGIDGQRPDVYRWGFTHPLECEGKMHAGRGRPPNGPYTAWLAERGELDAFYEDYGRRQRQSYATSAWNSVLPTEAFEDVFIGRRAVGWLRGQPKDFPWHLFVSFVGPHDPFDPPTEYADRYRDAEVAPAIRCSGTPRGTSMRRRQEDFDEATIRETRRQYCAAIGVIDDQIGEILAALEERGEAEHTYVIFTSDHGEMLGDLGCYTKALPYEASLRVPCLIAGPDVPAGRRHGSMVELADLNPTICELAGLPPQQDIDARSMVPVLTGGHRIHREDAFAAIRAFSCLRTPRHKLVQWHSGESEFYDLEEDPDENRNLASEDPPEMAEASRRMRERLWGERGHWY